MNETFIQLENVDIGYGRMPILEGIDLTLAKGDYLGIVGPNGVGKTTLIRVLLGNLPVLAGQRRYPEGIPRFGYVPQRAALDPIFPLTIREIATMGRFPRRGLLGRILPEDRFAVETALERVGLREMGDRLYRELSGGQKQRALIARALASEPGILVLDEPTAGMDISSSKHLLDLVSALHEEHRLSVVLVTHLLGEVANRAQSLVLIEGGHCHVGPKDQILTSENLSKVYGVQVSVESIAGQQAIIVS